MNSFTACYYIFNHINWCLIMALCAYLFIYIAVITECYDVECCL